MMRLFCFYFLTIQMFNMIFLLLHRINRGFNVSLLIVNMIMWSLELQPIKTYRSDDIRHVGHCCARGGSQVHDLCPWLDVNLVHSAQDGCGQLRAEGVPGSVFNFALTFLSQGGNKWWVHFMWKHNSTYFKTHNLERENVSVPIVHTFMPDHCDNESHGRLMDTVKVNTRGLIIC